MPRQFNLQIDEQTYRNLARLARATERSKAATVSLLIRREVEREFGLVGVLRGETDSDSSEAKSEQQAA